MIRCQKMSHVFTHKSTLFFPKKNEPGQKDMQHMLDFLGYMPLQPAKLCYPCHVLNWHLNSISNWLEDQIVKSQGKGQMWTYFLKIRFHWIPLLLCIIPKYLIFISFSYKPGNKISEWTVMIQFDNIKEIIKFKHTKRKIIQKTRWTWILK